MKPIPLTKGKVPLVSDCDYAYLKRWKWCFSDGYAVRGQWHKGRTHIVRMHIVVATRAGRATERDVDHRNRNTLDNRRCNLRPATRHQTVGNVGLRADNTSGFRGASRFRNKWQAGIVVNGKREHIGHYDSKRDAALAYNKRAREVFGSFAFLNAV